MNPSPGAAGEPDETTAETLQSAILTSPAEPMLRRAIARTLAAPPAQRERLFTELVQKIVDFMAARPEERPWTCTIFRGLDGSTVFRGGVGHSLVIDPRGRLFRARSYEDFLTTYLFTDKTCEIRTLAPLYAQMREYRPS